MSPQESPESKRIGHVWQCIFESVNGTVNWAQYSIMSILFTLKFLNLIPDYRTDSLASSEFSKWTLKNCCSINHLVVPLTHPSLYLDPAHGVQRAFDVRDWEAERLPTLAIKEANMGLTSCGKCRA